MRDGDQLVRISWGDTGLGPVPGTSRPWSGRAPSSRSWALEGFLGGYRRARGRTQRYGRTCRTGTRSAPGHCGRYPSRQRRKDLLRDKLRTFDVGGPDQGRKEECFDVTREEARTLEEILLSDGWFRIEKAYGFHELADADDLILVATFCPIFPHGTFVGRPG